MEKNTRFNKIILQHHSEREGEVCSTCSLAKEIPQN